jgi:AcrR family transcriptional regulator
MMPSEKPPQPGKRQRTRSQLLANAIALFRERGIRETRLSEIARTSDVSPGTLFNHFPTKGLLAESWVRGELESMVTESVLTAVNEERSLRIALRSATARVAQATAAEPGLRLEAWALAGRAPSASGSEPSIQVRRALTRGIAQEQKREQIRADVASETLAELLLDALEGGLIQVLREEADPDRATDLEGSLRGSAQARIDLVLDGARKRNERVRLPARPRQADGAE